MLICFTFLFLFLFADLQTQESKGCGFVHFADSSSADQCVSEMSGKTLAGSNHVLLIKPAAAKRSDNKKQTPMMNNNNNNQGGLSFGNPFGNLMGMNPMMAAMGMNMNMGMMGMPPMMGNDNNNNNNNQRSSYGPDRVRKGNHRFDPMARANINHNINTHGNNIQQDRTINSSTTGGPDPVQQINQAVANPDQFINERGEVCLFVFYLPRNITNDELKNLFSVYGRVEQVNVPRESNGQGRGFAFVNMTSVQEAINAISQLNGYNMQGKRLKVTFKDGDKPGPNKGRGGNGNGGMMMGIFYL